jgi:micrococcal nuclease
MGSGSLRLDEAPCPGAVPDEVRLTKVRDVRSQSNLALASLASMLLGGLMTAGWPVATEAAEPPSREFAVCGTVRNTCVVDGDTFWLDGVKIRVADIDTPEISSPSCDAEYALGIRARDRLAELLNGGLFELRRVGSRDADQYGRKLRVVVRGGQSLGDRLVAEGLARTWTGRKESWCP